MPTRTTIVVGVIPFKKKYIKWHREEWKENKTYIDHGDRSTDKIETTTLSAKTYNPDKLNRKQCYSWLD